MKRQKISISFAVVLLIMYILGMLPTVGLFMIIDTIRSADSSEGMNGIIIALFLPVLVPIVCYLLANPLFIAGSFLLACLGRPAGALILAMLPMPAVLFLVYLAFQW